MAAEPSQKPVPLHPAYSVTNIQTKIRTLDGSKVTYSSWIKLFKLHAVAYKVSDHLDETEPPPETSADYASWKEIDALVLQWIYSTISDNLLVRVLETDSTARDAWVKIEKIFLSNKKARAAALETKFVNLTLSACSSLDDYCQQLQDLANQLGDVDQLNADWDLAQTMLKDEVIRQAARQSPSSVLITPQAQNTQQPPSTQPPPSQPSQHPNLPPSGYQRGQGRGRRQGYRGRGGRGRGGERFQQPINSPWSYQTAGYPQWAWWNTPPCPYPT
uniref:uncharacterized protein LOC122601482 n=1 Tax=Erigeron canadensis TaxID=72917 RepID=UPI001CB90304|nr:uncharacterized protein LOC122601482 [Erigeron canadensis]